MAKLALFTRLSITSMNVINLGRVLKKGGFEQVKRHGKRLFSVVELTFDQVKAHQMGISADDKVISYDVQQSENKQDNIRSESDLILPF